MTIVNEAASWNVTKELSIMLPESSIMLLESLTTLLESIYVTGINHDDRHMTIKVFYITGHWDHYNTTFYVRNLGMFEIGRPF